MIRWIYPKNGKKKETYLCQYCGQICQPYIDSIHLFKRKRSKTLHMTCALYCQSKETVELQRRLVIKQLQFLDKVLKEHHNARTSR